MTSLGNPSIDLELTSPSSTTSAASSGVSTAVAAPTAATASTATFAPAGLALKEVSKSFGSVQAVTPTSLEIGEGEFFSLLGPSGCGKTTLLRMLGGFEQPDSGEIWLAGKRIDTLPSHKRLVNTVFQRYALFPHLTVWENVAFGPRMKKWKSPDIQSSVKEALALVQMEEFAPRMIQTLSGGQQQRIALARALVNKPRLLLLDEPLSALDLKLRQQMQVELRALQRRLGHTFVFVTHDQEEALSLSDRIAVMSKGRVEQVGTPQEIYDLPKTRFVAGFIGTMNDIPVEVKEHGTNGLVLNSPLVSGRRTLTARNGVMHSVGEKHTLMVRPEKLKCLKSAPGPEQNALEGVLREILYQGPVTHLFIGVVGAVKGETETRIMITQPNLQANARRTLNIGDKVFAAWAPEDSILL